jgi:hypothetical protein
LKIRLHILLVLLSVQFLISLPASTQTIVDYKSIAAEDGSTSPFPTPYSYGTLGPFIAYGKIWVFYSDGEYAVWKTKQVAEGGNWEPGGYVFDVIEARYFNMAFDGEYFHFIRSMNDDLRYLRGRAQPDGSIVFDPEVTAYSDPLWKVYRHTNPDWYPRPRHFAVTVDSQKRPWVIVKVSDGPDAETAFFKPIALSSTANDGTWVSRSGFPVDLATTYRARQHGRAPAVIEIEPGEILFSWGNHPEPNNNSERGFRARLWFNGVLGPVEDTKLDYHSSGASVVIPQPGIAILNSQTQVARRNSDGSWTRVDPNNLNGWDYNSLSAYNNKVRIWDYFNGTIRYKETEDNGTTWSSVVTKWPVGDILHFSASHDVGSHGKHHSLLWSEGTGPYDVVMGIEGEYEIVPVPDIPLLVSPVDGSLDVLTNTQFSWNESSNANSYRLQIALDPGFSNIHTDLSNLTEPTYEALLDYATAYYWRVNASNHSGTSEWSEEWMFTTIVEKPEIPLLVSPSNGLQDVSIDPVLIWESSERADKYHVQLSPTFDFSNLLIDNNNVVDTSLNANSLDHHTEYYWRVRAENIGGVSDWSQVWDFATVVEAAGSPLLVSPENGSVDIATETFLVWNVSERTEAYSVQISTNIEFSSIVVDTNGIADTNIAVNALENSVTYFWRVRAENAGGASNWSSVWNFTTIVQAPGIPVLAYPQNGDTNIAIDTVLVWETSARAESYHAQVSADSEFSTVILDSAGITNSHLAVNGLDSMTTYYWRVKAKNNGGESNWSQVWNFTTANVTIVDSVDIHVPYHYALSQNYPNPFNPSTRIRYSVPDDVYVRLVVYNVLGQLVTELVNGEMKAGSYEVIFDARDLPSGIYIYHLTAGYYVETKRMMLTK